MNFSFLLENLIRVYKKNGFCTLIGRGLASGWLCEQKKTAY
jgi:hypothetical protein